MLRSLDAFLWLFNRTLDKHPSIKEFTDKVKPRITKVIKNLCQPERKYANKNDEGKRLADKSRKTKN